MKRHIRRLLEAGKWAEALDLAVQGEFWADHEVEAGRIAHHGSSHERALTDVEAAAVASAPSAPTPIDL